MRFTTKIPLVKGSRTSLSRSSVMVPPGKFRSRSLANTRNSKISSPKPTATASSVSESCDAMSAPCAIIDTAALRHNLGVVRQRAPTSRVMAVIKANAYGHGILAVARALADVEAFGVARLSEAVSLRHGRLQQRIVLLEGVFSTDEL